jgi:hypothetical protein
MVHDAHRTFDMIGMQTDLTSALIGGTVYDVCADRGAASDTS